MPRDAFEQLYEGNAERLLAFLVYRTGDPALAEDVLADTFERVLTARRRFDPGKASARTWLYSIALNRLTDHQRRVGAEGRAYERVAAGLAATATLGPAETLGDRDAVMTALAGLGKEEREAIALRYGADLSIGEIATIAGTPQSTIKMRIHRGLRRLRDELA